MGELDEGLVLVAETKEAWEYRQVCEMLRELGEILEEERYGKS